jgi:hypothetical protein
MSTFPSPQSSGIALANAVGELQIPERSAEYTLECITGSVDYLYISSIRKAMRLLTLESSLVSVLRTLAHSRITTYLLEYYKLIGLVGIGDDLILECIRFFGLNMLHHLVKVLYNELSCKR